MSDTGRPYHLAPAYDMTPMAFAPNSGGKLNHTIPSLALHASVRNDFWRQALALAHTQDLKLGVRPEYISVHDQAAEGCLPAQVLRWQDLGTSGLLTAQCGSAILRLAHLPPSARIAK